MAVTCRNLACEFPPRASADTAPIHAKELEPNHTPEKKKKKFKEFFEKNKELGLAGQG